MAVFEFKKYKISLNSDTNKTQGLRTGDIVRRQYADSKNIIYSLMCVLETGEDSSIVDNEIVKSQYFIGALLEGDVPLNGQLLDFVRITNMFDLNRSGVLYLTSSDQQSPYMDVIDGIAKNRSLCWPEGLSVDTTSDSQNQYVVMGKEAVDLRYFKQHTDNSRALRITVSDASYQGAIGIQQDFYQYIQSPQRVLVSYKIKANRDIEGIKGSIGYTNDDKLDGEFTTTASEVWEYRFHAITIENSGRHLRSFKLDINSSLRQSDEIIIADLNILLLSSLSNYQESSHVRIGKLNGVRDDVFGDVEGYGGYMQRLYASKSANISGTLTAGDEHGFASTFYAGKIHRNAFVNSIDVDFGGTADKTTVVVNPTKVGNVYSIVNSAICTAQTSEWLKEHVGQQYTLSFWALTYQDCVISVLQNNATVLNGPMEDSEVGVWRRIKCTFYLNAPKKDTDNLLLTILVASQEEASTAFFTSPQLESGGCITQYQPTDETLNITDEYGAWFNRGGIGGTIQNPLLQLNFDGNGGIGTRTKSFFLGYDGSGHLANKNISWNKDGHVTFGDNVKINWKNISQDAIEEILPKSVKINGVDTIKYTMNINGVYASNVECVELIADEINIGEGAERSWSYFNGSKYILFQGESTNDLVIGLDDECWGQENQLMIKYEVKRNLSVYYDTITIRKTYWDGYQIMITSSQGESFRNGICATQLSADVYFEGVLVSQEVIEKSAAFRWVKYTYPDLETPVEGWCDEIVGDDGEVLQQAINPEAQTIQIYNANLVKDKYVCILSVENIFPYPSPMIL